MNQNWVCFDCRYNARRTRGMRGSAHGTCPRCGLPLRCIGTKVELPEQTDERGWRQLLAQINKVAAAVQEQDELRRARKRHAIEKRIAGLERLQKNKDRDRLIRSLRVELQNLLRQAGGPMPFRGSAR